MAERHMPAVEVVTDRSLRAAELSDFMLLATV
jgi:hypothetical protein